MNSTIIFISNIVTLKKISGYLVGYVELLNNNLTFYIVDKVEHYENVLDQNSKLSIIGYDNFNINDAKYLNDSFNNHGVNIKEKNYFLKVYHTTDTDTKLTIIIRNIGAINSEAFKLNETNFILIYYDHKEFLNSYLTYNYSLDVECKKEVYNDHFHKLSNYVKSYSKIPIQQKEESRKYSALLIIKKIAATLLQFLWILLVKFLQILKPISKYSSLVRHLQECLESFEAIWIEGNKLHMACLAVSLLTDLLAGGLALWYLRNCNDLIGPLMDGAEYIVETFRELLRYLMGSPVGLKLNVAFNTMLGRFFLYHIELWWKFLVLVSPWMQLLMKFVVVLGSMGLSFQAAMLTDLLSLVSFHVYCIYVYAARLYNIQIKGLKALWRLFLGRKYNPLRDRVDSCCYSHRQLFVGTLAFTVLLFLFPTTAVYYVVFTTLRVFVMVLSEILDRIRVNLHTLPLYTSILWVFGSTAVPCTIHLTLLPSPSCLRVTPQPLPPWRHNDYIPNPIKHAKRKGWNGIAGKIMSGELVYPLY